MKQEILAVAPMLEICMDDLQAEYDVHRLYQADDREVMLAEIGPGIEAIATDATYGVAPDIMAACPNLKMISGFGVGYDAVDLPACRERGIRVTNTPDVLNDAVAEMGMALMLALARQIPQADQYVRTGRWEREGLHPLTGELTGSTVGILGLGRIGKEVAARARAFKMDIVYYGRSEQTDQPFRYYADLTEMARDVDWLMVIAPATPETKGIVSRQVMEALGPNGGLINIARGALVDEEALVEVLKEGTLGGAALDVFVAEPKTPKELWDMDNVVLQPHQASATWRTRRMMGQLVVDNLKAWHAGEPLLTPVI